MRFAGMVPEDAPDPRVEARGRLVGLPFPLMSLVPQPTVEQIGAPGIAESTDGEGRRLHLAVMLSYVLWRNPADRTDPANLKEVVEREQPANDSGPLSLPAWIVEYNEMTRYPQLWDAVQTSWYQDDGEHTTLMQQLIDHTNYILVNQFREQLGLTREGPEDGPWQAGQASVDRSAVLEIDERTVPALEIDTDPFVYAVGAQIERNVVTTVVVDREHLPYVRLALRTWNPEFA